MAVITISRQYGSLGDEIAVRVCEMLGYRYFDRHLMEELAAELSQAGQPGIDLSEDNYHVRTAIERLLNRPAKRPEDPCRSWLEEGPDGVRVAEWLNLDEATAIQFVQNALQVAERQGEVLILGRGGQAFLKNHPGVLHVRIQAPFEQRVETVVCHCGFTHAKAREVITRKDRAAAEYLRRFYQVEPSDPKLYHLVIDTGVIQIEPAAQMIAIAARNLQPVQA